MIEFISEFFWFIGWAILGSVLVMAICLWPLSRNLRWWLVMGALLAVGLITSPVFLRVFLVTTA
jgi:hypothetical protein